MLYEDNISKVDLMKSKVKERKSVLRMGRQDNAAGDNLLDICSVV